MVERIEFDAPAGILGLMVAFNCMADVLATLQPQFGPALTVRYQTKIAELEAADEEAPK